VDDVGTIIAEGEERVSSQSARKKTNNKFRVGAHSIIHHCRILSVTDLFTFRPTEKEVCKWWTKESERAIKTDKEMC